MVPKISYKDRDLFRHDPQKLQTENPSAYDILLEEYKSTLLDDSSEIADGLNDRRHDLTDDDRFDPRD